MSTIDEIEQLIISGQIESAKTALKKQLGRKRTPQETLKLANFSRRLSLSELSLKLLFATLHDPMPASPEEKCEYATSLIQLGYYREGDEILSQIESETYPKSLLFLAFSHIYRWDYFSAEEKLNLYLKKIGNSSEYDSFIGLTNLAACMVINSAPFTETEYMLKDLLQKIGKTTYLRLKANLFELSAHLYIYNDRYDDAKRSLDSAESILSDLDAAYDGFYIQKWRIILNFKKNPNSNEAIEAVGTFRAKSLAHGRWEIARDCDLHLGISNRNQSVLQHLYFGTPFESYRQRILRLTDGKIVIPETYNWRIQQSQPSETILDIGTGKIEGPHVGEDLFKKSQALSLLQSLAGDFYRPLRSSSVFEKIFPGEYYDPFSTPNRIHQVVWRLKKELKARNIPLEINSEDGFQIIATTPGFGLKIGLQGDLKADPISILKSEFKDEKFNSKQASEVLNYSLRKTQQILKAAIEESQFKQIGTGKNTKYHF